MPKRHQNSLFLGLRIILDPLYPFYRFGSPSPPLPIFSLFHPLYPLLRIVLCLHIILWEFPWEFPSIDQSEGSIFADVNIVLLMLTSIDQSEASIFC